jgi:hypothetical protein
MIQIKEDVFWDNLKPLAEQSEECQQLIAEITQQEPTSTTDEPAGVYPRILSETFVYGNISVVQRYEYVHEATHRQNGLIKEVQHYVEMS